MTMNTKAGRLGQSDLSAAIEQAAEAAKARISKIEGGAIDSVGGGIDIPTTTGDHDDGIDWTTDGAIMPDPFPDPFPTPDILKF